MQNLNTLFSYHPSDDYNPSNDPDYMSKQMLNYFKDKLQKMADQILRKEEAISLSLIGEPYREPDYIDQGANEGFHNEDFMLQEHEDKLRHEIEMALQRIDEGTYGYCEETDIPIGVKRLLIVPYARYSLKVQASKEAESKRLQSQQ